MEPSRTASAGEAFHAELSANSVDASSGLCCCRVVLEHRAVTPAKLELNIFFVVVCGMHA